MKQLCPRSANNAPQQEHLRHELCQYLSSACRKYLSTILPVRESENQICLLVKNSSSSSQQAQTHHHSPRNASAACCRSCDENLDGDRPSGSVCCVHYDDLAADNCYYPDWADGATTNPCTDGSEDSLQPLPAWQIFNYSSSQKKNLITNESTLRLCSKFERLEGSFWASAQTLRFYLILQSAAPHSRVDASLTGVVSSSRFDRV